VFPGTNCEYETGKACERAGAVVDTLIFRNLTTAHINESLERLRKKIGNTQIIVIPGGFSAGDEPDGSGKFIAAVFRNPAVSEAVTRFLQERDGLMLGICNGFQALIKLGLLPHGEIRYMDEASPILTFNRIGRHVSCMVRTKVTSVLSPWFMLSRPGDIHTIPISHGEGRFIAPEETLNELLGNGQVATQYVNLDGQPTYDIAYNPNGSMFAVEGITSPDGKILGKMGHSERMGAHVCKNVPGEKDQKLFESGVKYFE
jgi:phosphoribosylformylglycinamidine synthase